MRFELMVLEYVLFQVRCIKPLCHMSLISLFYVVFISSCTSKMCRRRADDLVIKNRAQQVNDIE